MMILTQMMVLTQMMILANTDEGFFPQITLIQN